MLHLFCVQNELLLDRLVLLCSAVILDYSNINNACYVLADATYFHAQQLVERLQAYMAVNMEVLLESHMLDDLAPALVKQLAQFVRREQAERAPVSRTNRLGSAALVKQAEWLALQDIPEAIVPAAHRAARVPVRKDAVGASGPGPVRRAGKASLVGSLQGGPGVGPAAAAGPRPPPAHDDIFAMDDVDGPVPVAIGVDHSVRPSPGPLETKPGAVWKAPSAPR